MRAHWLIVGAGFTGCTLAERIATQLGQTVVVIDRRDHIGGNAYDCLDAHGLLVHRYGPHIFHTNSHRVWEYLSGFTRWRPYVHRVLAVVDGAKVPVPFNLTSLERLYPREHADRLTAKLVAAYGPEGHVPILRLRDADDPEVRDLAEFVYDRIFLGYTQKQWGLRPEQLDPSVTARVPVRVSHDDRYFQDTFQAMPAEGYTAMFQRMLRHRNIEVLLGTDYSRLGNSVRSRWTIYTGAIDEFFEYLHGELPYRSLRFEFHRLEQRWFQEVGTVNYPNERAYTRITEFKHLTGQDVDRTTIVAEYPMTHRAGETEPYYPVPREENRLQYMRYLVEAQRLRGAVLFAGRLADYKYYNMDQAVARALKLFRELRR